jgi:hypothetical protein
MGSHLPVSNVQPHSGFLDFSTQDKQEVKDGQSGEEEEEEEEKRGMAKKRRDTKDLIV